MKVQHRLHWLVVSLVFGGMLPILVARLMGAGWREMGLGGAGVWGWRVTALGVLLTVPFAWWMAGERVASGWDWGRVDRLELWVALGVSVPEHLLLTGVGLAWMMPRGRLVERMPLVEGAGRPWVIALRWLGLAQPVDSRSGMAGRAVTWMGLRGDQVPAMVMGGLVFGLVHVGARPIELAASFPGGVALCYLACRSRSIWPGWVIHVSQMALVAGMVWWRSG